MRIRKIIFLFLFVILLAGCITTPDAGHNTGPSVKEIMESWVGHHKSEIIQSWGPPDSYASDGKEGEILIYNSSRTVVVPAYGMMLGKTITDYKHVYVNERGNIYHVRWGRE